MKQGAIKWTLVLGALLAAGPVAWLLTGTLRGADGARDATPLLSISPAMGVVKGLIAIGLAAAVGYGVAVKVTARYGVFCAGLVLAWAAWGTGNIDAILRVTPERAALWRLAVEGLILGVPAAAAGWFIMNREPVVRDEEESATRFRRLGAGASPWALDGAALGVTLVAAVLAAWLVAQNTLKGQTVVAAMMAGVLAGVAITALTIRARPGVLVVGVVVMAFAGPAVGALVEPTGTALVMAANGGLLTPTARILPLDWIAGAFLGVPIGLSLLGSVAEG